MPYKITWKCGVTSVFHLNCTKKYTKITLIFRPSKSVQYKRRQNFAHRSYAEQSTSKNVDFCLSKLHRRKCVESTAIFRTSKFHQRNYVKIKIMWKFIDMFFSTYRQNIDIKSDVDLTWRVRCVGILTKDWIRQLTNMSFTDSRYN